MVSKVAPDTYSIMNKKYHAIRLESIKNDFA